MRLTRPVGPEPSGVSVMRTSSKLASHGAWRTFDAGRATGPAESGAPFASPPEGARGIVGSSFGPLPLLLDARRASGDVVDPFSPARSDLRDGLPPLPPVLDELREDLSEFLHDRNE